MRIQPITTYKNYYFQNKKTPSFQAMNKNVLTQSQMEEFNDLRVFNHHIYEYKKGLRHLILTTEKEKHREAIEKKLINNNIPYVIHSINQERINVYFGDEECIDVVRTFNPKLNKLSAEQDFILGIMLGYDRVKQCERYLKIKNKQIKLGKPEE